MIRLEVLVPFFFFNFLCTSKVLPCQDDAEDRKTCPNTSLECAVLAQPLPTSLTQLRRQQLGHGLPEDTEVGAQAPLGVQEQVAQVSVPLVCALHAAV